jgi:CheY-like chemotaxis protein
MSVDIHKDSPAYPTDLLSRTTSELNNLLQIIGGTSSLVERACAGNPGCEAYIVTLRATIERAEKLSANLVKLAGGPVVRSLMNDQLAPDGQPKSAQSSGKKPQILIVDDEQATLGLVSTILSNAEYEVTTAQSGFECLDHFRQQAFQFDLVLLDLTMPFMDGEETFHRLRELRPDLPVVMCTGFIQHERLQRLMSEGLSGFLRKPVAPDEIVSHIGSTLAKVRYSRDRTDRSRMPARV